MHCSHSGLNSKLLSTFSTLNCSPSTLRLLSRTNIVPMASPKIASISWGRITFETASLPEGKDFKLFPGGGREWDWNETGTRHSPGIQQGDVEELLKAGATDVVLSRGMDLKLEVPDKLVRWLEEQGVRVHVAETKAAVEIYNRLVDEGIKVGGCFHSTC